MGKKKSKEAGEERAEHRKLIDLVQALRSLDRRKIESYLRKNGDEVIEDETLFWLDVHRSRAKIGSMTPMEHIASLEWLMIHELLLTAKEKFEFKQRLNQLKQQQASY